jgi:hypothetical protein
VNKPLIWSDQITIEAGVFDDKLVKNYARYTLNTTHLFFD